MAGASGATRDATEERGHRVLVPILVAVGALCILVSAVSIWVRDAALNTDVWVDESGQLLASQDVRNLLAIRIVDASFAAANVPARVADQLPPRLKPLAGPASAQLRTLAYRTASQALARPRVQELWRDANRAAHQRLVAVIEGESSNVQITSQGVVLDLGVLVSNVAGRIGATGGAAQAIESKIQPIVILRSDQLETVQRAVEALNALSFWPLIGGVAIWAGAVYLARGRRREAVRAIALTLILLGVMLLVVRRLGGNAIVDALVQAESAKAAAHDVWAIFTTILADVAAAGIAIGAVALLGTWAAGPTRSATAVRRWLAPTFRDTPALPHVVLAIIILLVLLWAPTGAPRRIVTVAIVAAFAFLGLELLRRQTVREFPDAVRGGGAGPPDEPSRVRPEPEGRPAEAAQARAPGAPRGGP